MKKILIIGGSSGLGLEMYNNLSIDYNVYRASRSKLKNNFSVDFTSEDKVKKFFKNLKKKLKKIHTIIYCVGMSKSKQENIQEWKKIFDINFFSFVNTLNSYCDVYKKQSTKFIVVSSIAGSANISGAPITYSIAKNALTKYSIYKSKELAKHQITLNVISPGNILQENNLWSKKLKDNPKKTRAYIKKNVPLNSFVKPASLIETCKLIIDMDSNQITGQNIIIDGGQIL